MKNYNLPKVTLLSHLLLTNCDRRRRPWASGQHQNSVVRMRNKLEKGNGLVNEIRPFFVIYFLSKLSMKFVSCVLPEIDDLTSGKRHALTRNIFSLLLINSIKNPTQLVKYPQKIFNIFKLLKKKSI